MGNIFLGTGGFVFLFGIIVFGWLVELFQPDRRPKWGYKCSNVYYHSFSSEILYDHCPWCDSGELERRPWNDAARQKEAERRQEAA